MSHDSALCRRVPSHGPFSPRAFRSLWQWIVFLPMACLFLPLSGSGRGVAQAGDDPGASDKTAEASEPPIEILMIAGRPSHGFGSHEHYAGLRILGQALEASNPRIRATVVRGWPEDEALLDRAASIVIYSDGGGGHVAMRHRDQLREKLAEGKGFVCLHYAVEMVPGEPGDDWLEFLGGHFEINWSVNPHWVAEFESFPDHPIARGVEPFAVNDEWYFHLRFRDEGVTPILAAVAPESTMRRPDGHHSGNPAVRKSVAAGETQTLAWAYDRPGGGRSFGFTGGHFHWNWGVEPFLRVVTNAIRWTAGDEIEPDGSRLTPIDMPRLLANQDYDPPANFDPDRIVEQYGVSRDAGGTSTDESRGERPDTRDGAFLDPADMPPHRFVSTGAGTADDDPRHPSRAIDGLSVAPGLELTLVASEPDIRSLTNLDIDDRGRIWVCDVMNYRHNNDSRPEGDRILILEDTTGDGVADEIKTFYQGREIDSAMGICVLPGERGTEVIVSASPYVWRFVDEDGDDVPDRMEAIFTETGQPQHDHSAHSFLFGPDGKFYWNFGNTGRQVKDARGETVVDIHGRAVVDNGAPFYGGMIFRCDADGGEFEVLAHNFRNNYETAVDSFGGLWQSDNDDDGNRGTRINFVMEHGNYGYRDELTGAGWRDDRITMEDEIPLQHWHLNDPGVVPNLLQTGAGSPCGICIYEGRLLPERFWDQMIHCDPGPNVVRAYPVRVDGAGYTATIEPLVTGTDDKWFRPADVCVAPDGSLFVTDWYDPGVGGHRQGDLDRGRLFRIAPPGSEYRVPVYDYATAEGAAEALRNPALSVRYRAWTALHAMGSDAEAALRRLYADENPRLRARALWLLGMIEGRGQRTVAEALADPDPDIRATAIRLAKRLRLDIASACAGAAADESPAVRRELAIALRFDESAAMPGVWAALAEAYPAGDRWYLEALGIGSDLRAAECLDAWLRRIDGRWDTAAGRDIVWRLRAPDAAGKLIEIIADESLPLEETKRFFRSLEYHDPPTRQAAVGRLLDRYRQAALSADPSTGSGDAPSGRTVAVREPVTDSDSGAGTGTGTGNDARRDAVIALAVERTGAPIPRDDVFVTAAIARHVARQEGSADYLKLLQRFRPEGARQAIEGLMFRGEIGSDAVEATRVVSAEDDGPQRLRDLVRDEDLSVAVRTATLLGLVGSGRGVNVLAELVAEADDEQPYERRAAAVRGLASSNLGAKRLLELAAEGTLPRDTHLLVGGLLSRSNDASIREQAGERFPRPQQPNREPLPPLSDLAQMRGDIASGIELFRTKGTCANCHVVNGEGKAVGPDLSEIGSKLSREAMLTSILDPSAGISHNYETTIVLLDSGQVITGVMVSETADRVVIRTAEAIDRTVSRDEIEELKKGDVSIMPADLHHATGQQGLIDIVEYLMTLRQKS